MCQGKMQRRNINSSAQFLKNPFPLQDANSQLCLPIEGDIQCHLVTFSRGSLHFFFPQRRPKYSNDNVHMSNNTEKTENPKNKQTDRKDHNSAIMVKQKLYFKYKLNSLSHMCIHTHTISFVALRQIWPASMAQCILLLFQASTYMGILSPLLAAQSRDRDVSSILPICVSPKFPMFIYSQQSNCKIPNHLKPMVLRQALIPQLIYYHICIYNIYMCNLCIFNIILSVIQQKLLKLYLLLQENHSLYSRYSRVPGCSDG